jgi:quercetin dioxygenase-like cupin family protein
MGGLLMCGRALAADELKSGPQVGENTLIPLFPVTVFHAEKPERAGTRSDFVEEYGASPVVIIFARTVSAPLNVLVKRLDAELARHKQDGAKVHAYLVMLSDENLEKKLKDFAERQRIKNISLAIDGKETDPRGWKLARNADVTIILYNRRKVEGNHAFRKGELNEKTIDVVLNDLPKILKSTEAAVGRPAGGHQESADIASFSAGKIKWRDGPRSLPKGAMFAVLEGDPSKEGPFVFRVKIPDGYRVPPHTHPKTERVTVISGTFNIGMGDRFDENATTEMPAGTYGHWGAGMKHFVWAKGETILQFHGMGPWSIQYVNPADDPRRQRE